MFYMQTDLSELWEKFWHLLLIRTLESTVKSSKHVVALLSEFLKIKSICMTFLTFSFLIKAKKNSSIKKYNMWLKLQCHPEKTGSGCCVVLFSREHFCWVFMADKNFLVPRQTYQPYKEHNNSGETKACKEKKLIICFRI